MDEPVHRVAVRHEAEVVYDRAEVRVTMSVGTLHPHEYHVGVSESRVNVTTRDGVLIEVPVWAGIVNLTYARAVNGLLEIVVPVQYVNASPRVEWRQYALPGA